MTEQEAIEIVKNFSTWNLEDQWLEVSKMELLTKVIIDALEQIQKYHDMERKLQEIYGENNGLLGMIVNQLYKHEGVDIPGPVFKSRLLTDDDDVDKWEQYKSIGTVDERREAREKQIQYKPTLYQQYCWKCRCGADNEKVNYCPVCGKRIINRC